MTIASSPAATPSATSFAGIFDASRTGDDTSGRDWERTRRLGVDTLAFRLPQHAVLHAIDADCVALTPDVPLVHEPPVA